MTRTRSASGSRPWPRALSCSPACRCWATAYWLTLAHLDRDVRRARHLVGAVLRADALHLAGHRGLLRPRRLHRRARASRRCPYAGAAADRRPRPARCWRWLVGVATLRLSGVYFVIFTLGLAEFIRQVVTWVQNNFSGSRGLYVLTDLTDRHIYWQLLALGAAGGLDRLGGEPLAPRLRAAHHRRRRAGGGAHAASTRPRAKVALFVISGVFAAIVGAIMAPRFTYIEPSMAFSPDLSFQVVIMALLGGVHRLWGPLVGVIPFTLLWEADLGQLPDADRAAARRGLPADRVLHPARRRRPAGEAASARARRRRPCVSAPCSTCRPSPNTSAACGPSTPSRFTVREHEVMGLIGPNGSRQDDDDEPHLAAR